MRIVLVMVAALLALDVQAGPPRRYRNRPMYQQEAAGLIAATPTIVSEGSTNAVKTAADKVAVGQCCAEALDEVNAERAKRGLRPFIHDPLLSQAAYACAKERARNHIHGHLASDFAYLPSGASATAAGCGALEPSWGWGSCCVHDDYTYGGAAWVMGDDGRRYMHLFVR